MATEFDYAASNPYAFITPLPGGTNQQAQRWGWWVGHAFDASANRYWAWNPYTQAWIGSGSGTPDPAAGTGGLDVSGISGSKYPMWSGYYADASENVRLVSATADLMNTIPSGFQSLATMAGGAVTWNPSDKSSDITLSSSDSVATHTSTNNSWPSVRATSAISGKTYWETQHRATTNFLHMIGMGNSSASLSQYPGQNANSFAWYLSSSSGAFFGASGGTPGAWPAVQARAAKTTLSRTTGKYFFESRFSTDSGGAFYDAAKVSIGLVQSAVAMTDDMGRLTGGCSYFANGGHYTNNVPATATSGFANLDYVLSVFDLGAGKNWNYVNGSWDTGSPLTPTGGTDISGITGSPLYPAVSMANISGMRVTMNFASSFNYSSVVSSLEAIGYTAWDIANSSGSRSRGIIIP